MLFWEVLIVYLDYSANTPTDPRVAEAFLRASLDYPSNPNSRHPAGQAATKIPADARTHITALLRILPEELIFTSGATEASNLALLGNTAARRHVGRHIISTAFERPSVSTTLSYLQEVGYEIDLPPILPSSCIGLNALSSLLRKDICLVSFSTIGSELGTLQPLAETTALIQHFPDCHFRVDATQAMSKVPIDFSVVDGVSFAPYKFYGLVGSGILCKKKGIPLYPQLHGGKSDSPCRSSMPAPARVHAPETALEFALAEGAARYDLVATHNVYLHATLKEEARVTVNSPTTVIPHILDLSVVGLRGAAIQATLALSDICISVGSACSTDALPSRAVLTVNRSRKNALASFHLSLSHLTTCGKLDALLGALAPLLH